MKANRPVITTIKKTRRSPEANLQIAVCQWLFLAGVKYLIYFAVPNGMVSDGRTVARMKLQGLRPGVADLIIAPPHSPWKCLELKSPEGVQSPEQKKFQADCVANGTQYAIADNIDDAIRILIEWGALRVEMCGKWGKAKRSPDKPLTRVTMRKAA